MSPVIQAAAFWVFIAIVSVSSAWPLLSWAWANRPKFDPSLEVPKPPTGTAEPTGQRTAGDVLDCLRCDMQWLLANTDATDADVAPVEALAKFLIHTSKTTAKAGA